MEIYLTKMILNSRSRQVRSEIGSLHELHRTISRGFPVIENQESVPPHLKKTPRNQFNVLHRLEIDPRRGRTVLLVQSAAEPDWSFLPADYAEEIRCKAVHESYQAVKDGMILLFRLRANPVKRVGQSDPVANEKFKDKNKRRRVELRTDEDRISWLERKGAEAGFRLTRVTVAPDAPNVAATEQGKINSRKYDKTDSNKSHTLTFGSVVFEGVLQVTDAERFKEALRKGIGSGKAYGFGLLSVAPVREV